MWFFTKTDPICGMKETKEQGIAKHDKWFCSQDCLKKYEKQVKETSASHSHGGCCH